jgi:hypothetical protein
MATAGDTIYAWIRGVDTSGNRQAWQSLGSSPVGTAAPAPTDAPNAPSWVEFTGGNGIFHFKIAPGSGALTTLEHEIQIASDSGFTADLLTLVLGSALTKDLGMPSVTRYARARSRYISSPFSSYVNFGAPTAVSSGADAPAPTDAPNAPSWIEFSGEDGIFHFEISPGSNPLTNLEHEIQLASNSSFTTGLRTLVLGSALVKDLLMPRVTRYARARSRYVSSSFSAYVAYGAPTAVWSGHPVDDLGPEGGFDPGDRRLHPGVRQNDAGGTPRTIFRIADHNLDDVGDGSTYGRVLGARITLGVPYVYRGVWVPSTSYLKGDEVAYPSVAAGNVYACMVANSDAVWTVAHWLLIGPATVDQVVDGSTYARPLGSRLSSGKPLIDFSEGIHLNKHLDNIPDGTTYGRPLTTALTGGAVDLAKSGVVGKAVELIRNPNFESGDRDWDKGSGFSIVNDPTNAYDGSWVAKFVGTTIGAFRNALFVAVQPGDVLLATCMIKRTGGNGSGYVRIDWLNASQTEIGSSDGNAITSASYASSRVLGTAPAGAFFGRVEAVASGTSSTTCFFDRFNASLFPKSLDDVPNGTRAAWDSGTQKAAAVDASGNILLKNVAVVNGVTSNPILTGNGTYQTVTDLSITVTTKGNEVYLSFAAGFSATDTYTAYLVYFALFRDTTRVSPEYGIQATDSMQYTALGVYIDSPSAASHTFTVKCKASLNVNVTLVGTQRSLSVIELG